MPNTAKTLVLLAHPNLANSRVNAALADVARQEEHVTVHDLYAAYPDFRIDVAREQRLLLAHDAVTLQFPFQWYSTPSLLKLWLDEVLTYGWAFGEGGTALHGKTLRFAISTGHPAEAYGPDGINRFTMAELLRPLEATANLIGMTLAEPLILQGNNPFNPLPDETLALHAKHYRQALAA
ncbi:NAD(P)H-dependent oxidoreductase [Frankia sp. Cppng1_Ct_nod]|uniref:NAD(P)H-dependent oxidoreductase n=1 Tax=Frankia sp. Cppng1_Ct_nod TaxID=2897162 RepID=UPI0010419543|nr:NAD(P)H-dependent oxidoreductase [Frankia sp. Cppng1_Ct_nod]